MTDWDDVSCPDLPFRPVDGHKGTFGKVLVIGGAPGMSGSVCLTGKAALRAGSGLVTVAVPESIQAIVAGFEPSYMTVGMPCDSSGQLLSLDEERVHRLTEGMDAAAIGPGFGRSSAVSQLVSWLWQHADVPLVLDADALNVLAAESLRGFDRSGSTASAATRIITPHPGEFSRLTGLSTSQIAEQRELKAFEFAKDHNLIVVLKGHRTIVTDGRRVFTNMTGNSGMATGGSGDVLTGIIASLVGQRMDAFSAAALGVHVHGLAGDLAAAALSERGMIASDLLAYLPAAWLSLERTSGSQAV